ncbi:MAG: 16S rRNA (cytosine(1402)-N(4))-methyltransferase RsmH [Patescibacteria group bacterium]
MPRRHIPVLENEVINQFRYLDKLNGAVFVDATLGAAGHSIMLAESLKPKNENVFIGIDQDEKALEIAKKEIKQAGFEREFILVHDNFENIASILKELDYESIDGALLDIGVSSMQIDELERGFSFKDPNQPLDMRMDCSKSLTAGYLLNNYPESRINNIIHDFGEEQFSRVIARNIIEARKAKKMNTIGDLLSVLERSIPVKIQKTSRVNFATKTFQALRIEVNQELEILEKSINDFVGALKPGGRLAIITFHSLEDRIVKQTFKLLADPCQCPKSMPCICNKKPTVKMITKKPVGPADDEIRENPRSRSAKLRVIEKLQ